jgi:hypothetical protein
MFRLLSKWATLAPSAAIVSLLVGCSGDAAANRGALSGAVTIDGKPLEQGSILFTPTDGTKGSSSGGEIKNGRYRISKADGPAIGWNRVEIRATRKTGKMIQKPFAPAGQMVEEQVELIPPQFNSQSELKVEVKPGDNTADFQVTSH